MIENVNKVVLAYSGGVDTTACIPYLKHELGIKNIIATVMDLGQDEDLNAIQKKALVAGATESLVIDAKEEFVKEYGFQALKANALYENQYPLSSALGRPLIAKLLVRIAEENNADGVAHGCTGIGNDQIRFDLIVSHLNPNLKIIAPAREWNMTRSECVEYIKKHGIPAHVETNKPYAFDLNILGCNMESGPIDDPWEEPDESIYLMTSAIEKTPDTPTYIDIGFEEGIPVSLDEKKLEAVELLKRLNKLAGMHCIGRVDMIENRILGIKSREIYEAPGYTVLLKAHRDLESITLPVEVTQFKSSLEKKYSNLIYDGFWESPLKECIDAFLNKSQEKVSGIVRVKLFKGMIIVVGRKSQNSLYDYNLIKYKKDDNLKAKNYSEGFIYFYGLSTQKWKKQHG